MKKKILSVLGGILILSGITLGQFDIQLSETRKQEANYKGDPGLDVYYDKYGDPKQKEEARISFWVKDNHDDREFDLIMSGNLEGLINGGDVYSTHEGKLIKIGYVKKSRNNGADLVYALVDVFSDWEIYKSYVTQINGEPNNLNNFAFNPDDWAGDEDTFQVITNLGSNVAHGTYSGIREVAENKVYYFESDDYIKNLEIGSPVFYNESYQNGAPVLVGIFNGHDSYNHPIGKYYYRFTPVWNLYNMGYIPYVWWTSGD